MPKPFIPLSPNEDAENDWGFRRGYTVPEGGVNIAWSKAPAVSPKNNIVMIDTSNISAANRPFNPIRKNVAYANASGLLEDVNGNQIWDEEYPIISDVFRDEVDTLNGNLDQDDILPYLHVSRFFHVAHTGLAFDDLEAYPDNDVRVVYKNGDDFVDPVSGAKRYRIFIVRTPKYLRDSNSVSAPYRVYAFIDYNPDVDDIYLEYNKVELTKQGVMKLQQISYRESVSPRPFFSYVPEEAEVVDRVNYDQKIYSTKPASMKEKILGLPQKSGVGWRIYVPKKALPDPRIFQIFQWRLACEFTRPVSRDADQREDLSPTMRVGVIVNTPTPAHANTRASFFFYQIEQSDFNVGGIKFVNPLQTSSDTNVSSNNDTYKQQASYWHVDINTVNNDDLAKFDILLWAPVANLNIKPYLPKIKYFTETLGGTLIFETSSHVKVTGLAGLTFGDTVTSSHNSASAGDRLTMSSLRFHDATPDDSDDTFTSFGMWKTWPVDVADIVNAYQDVGQILKSSSNIAGWDIDDNEEVSPYLDEIGQSPTCRWQSITVDSGATSWKTVLEAENSGGTYKPTLVYRGFTSGGGIFASTSCLFEDHLFGADGHMIVKTVNKSDINAINSLTNYGDTVDTIVDAPIVAGEMKLRVNTLLFATLFKPSPNSSQSKDPLVGLANNSDIQSLTVFTDWAPSWTINPENGVLDSDERDEFKFILNPTTIDGQTLKWQRVLSEYSAKQLIDQKLNKTYDKNDPKDKQILSALEGATRRYFILVTNPLVQVFGTEMVNDDTLVTAWTDAYSPRIEVPANFGAYKIRDEMVAGTGPTVGKKIYPSKTYELQTKAHYVNSDLVDDKKTATITINGSFYETRKIAPRTEIRKIRIPGIAGRYIDRVLHWDPDADHRLIKDIFAHHWHAPTALHTHTWTDANYANRATTCFPYFNQAGVISTGINMHDSRVQMIKDVMKQFIFFNLIPNTTYAELDQEPGYYGPKTAEVVRKFQARMGAQLVDGAIDAETWSLIGFACESLWHTTDLSTGRTWQQQAPQNIVRWVAGNRQFNRLESISNGSTSGPFFAVQSRYGGNTPTKISEGFNIGFSNARLNQIFGPGEIEITGMYLIPYCQNGNRLTLDWFDVRDSTFLRGYGYNQGLPGKVNFQAGDMERAAIDIRPVKWRVFTEGAPPPVPVGMPVDGPVYYGYDLNFVFRISMDQPVGRGQSRFMGIRDCGFYVRRYWPGTPDRWENEVVTIPGKTYQVKRNFTMQVRYTFTTGEPVSFTPTSTSMNTVINVNPEGANAEGELVNITDITLDQGSISITPNSSDFEVDWKSTSAYTGMSQQTIPKVEITYNGGNLSVSNESYTYGPRFGNSQTNPSAPSFWTKGLNSKVDPYRKTDGWINKQDGIRLICNQNGTPFGFPSVLPGTTTNDTQDTHFTSYTLKAFNTDQTLYYGFYDVVRKEFITNNYGLPEISYYDYIRRGPENVFIAVMTTYEIDTTNNLPNSGEAIDRPFKWVMPVYGVTTGTKAKIQMEPLSPELTNKDIWAIPIRTGSFAKEIAIRPVSQGGLTGYLSSYQGRTVTAYYEVIEAEQESWSSLYGRPYKDVRGETPIIVDDNIIKVRQSPILVVREVSSIPSLADPHRPVFTVYIREDLNSEWQPLDMYDIKDYNTWTGEITLRSPLVSNDPRLVKVDYTSQREVYHFRHTGSSGIGIINLNPYLLNITYSVNEMVNKPLYVYIVPSHILDHEYNLIEDSVVSRTLNLTTSPDTFNPHSALYNPTALLLGIVYITTAMNIDDLVVLDTRKRGGGATTRINDADLAKYNQEIYDYVDIEPDKAVAYQKGGFVIIRLPKELGMVYSQSEIERIIKRNITAGVAFKIEDLQGRDIVFSQSDGSNP